MTMQLPNCFLAYVYHFDIVLQLNFTFSGFWTRGPYREESSLMYILKRASRADRIHMGGIIPLQQIQEAIDLVP